MAQQSFDWLSWVLSHTRAKTLIKTDLLQNLWGGYGELQRMYLEGGAIDSAILKRVIPPKMATETVSDRRKRRSYAVEHAWYQGGSQACDADCRVASCYAVKSPSLLLLEDLGSAGFHPARPPQSKLIRGGLRWLAHFHSRFLKMRPAGLWKHGSYWHLDTRQDEWQRMPSGPLKDSARGLDQLLKGARYQTLLHGDAKPANFCWNSQGDAAAVDFQYVGPGCGIRDVAYFLDCCQGPEWLDFYFSQLREALHRDGHGADADALESEWRKLFPVAWSDFCRFEQGWGRPSPLDDYSQRQLRLALDLLK